MHISTKKLKTSRVSILCLHLLKMFPSQTLKTDQKLISTSTVSANLNKALQLSAVYYLCLQQ